MKKHHFLAVVIIVALCSGLIFLQLFVGQQIEKVELRIVNNLGENVTLRVEVATTPESRQRGLMGRESLGEYEGMLFVFEENGYHGFWMEDTSIPLSIAFIAAEGTIPDIQDMQPHSQVHRPQSPCLYALEVNQGFFAGHNITAGNAVILPPL